MTGVIDCVYFFTGDPEPLGIGEMVAFRGKLRVYSETVQVNVRSGLHRVKTKDEELYLLSRAVALLAPPKGPETVSYKRTARSVKPLHIVDCLRSLRLIEALQSFHSPSVLLSDLQAKSTEFVPNDQLRLKLADLAAMGLIDLHDSAQGVQILLEQRSIHPKDQVLQIVQSAQAQEGISIYAISEELGRRYVDMGFLAPMLLGELVNSGLVYEVEDRKFKCSTS